MTPVDARVALLRAELERDWNQAVSHLHRAESVDPARSPQDAAYVALSLDHAYQAFETMLLRIERALRLPERAGAHWHRAVLADATLPLPGLRPAIIPKEVERDWEHVLAFRHFLRHAYAVELDAERLLENVRHLRRAVAGTEPLARELMTALQED